MELEQVITGLNSRSGDGRANICARCELELKGAIRKELGILYPIDLCNNGEQFVSLALDTQNYMLCADQAGLQVLGCILGNNTTFIDDQDSVAKLLGLRKNMG
jgi:hypothetical protein